MAEEIVVAIEDPFDAYVDIHAPAVAITAMSEASMVVIEVKFDTIISHEIEVVVVNDNAMPGPPGSAGTCKISTDLDNAIIQGTDGGVYCPAVISVLSHW
jgi:hypothetical protein